VNFGLQTHYMLHAFLKTYGPNRVPYGARVGGACGCVTGGACDAGVQLVKREFKLFKCRVPSAAAPEVAWASRMPSNEQLPAQEPMAAHGPEITGPPVLSESSCWV